MKLFQKESLSGKNMPFLLLLAAGIIEFLFITLESRFSGVCYYLAENYVIVPCLLFLGYVLQEKQTPFARRRLFLAAAAVCWFAIVQVQHTLTGMESHPMATVFFVYLMGFPFAALADDRDDTGILWIGRLFAAAALVLVGYTVLLLLELVPSGLQGVLFWDGARLYALWHPNIAACYLMIGMGFSAVFWTRAEKTWVKGLFLVAIAVQFFAMSLTNCRTMLLMTGALLGGITFFRIFRGSWQQLILGLMAAAVLLVGSFKLSGMIFRWNNDRLLAAHTMAVEEIIADETVPAGVVAATEEALPQTTPPETTLPETTPSETTPPEMTPPETIPAETAPAVDDTGVISGDNPQGSLADDMRTLNGRTIIWRSALTAIRDNPTLVRWGTAYPGTVISVYNPWEVVHSHNSWMEALLRLGRPGLVMALAFTVISVWSAARLVLGKKTELWKKIVAMTTMCVLVAGFLEPYLFITNVYYHILDFVFFFCTGYLDYWCNHKETA